MLLDILEEGKEKKTVLRNFEDYLPKRRLWTGNTTTSSFIESSSFKLWRKKGKEPLA